MAGQPRQGRIIGAYTLPLYPGVLAIEAMVPDRVDWVDLAHFVAVSTGVLE
jgi:hypothetical protein